jgi:hypothetical protein
MIPSKLPCSLLVLIACGPTDLDLIQRYDTACRNLGQRCDVTPPCGDTDACIYDAKKIAACEKAAETWLCEERSRPVECELWNVVAEGWQPLPCPTVGETGE